VNSPAGSDKIIRNRTLVAEASASNKLKREAVVKEENELINR
jgi:hypothetical protein